MWIDRWAGLAARIEGLIGAGNLMALALAARNNDVFAVGKKWLVPEMVALKGELQQFATECGPELPPAAYSALQRVLASAGTGSDIEGMANAQAIVPFAIFRSEFEYLARDRELAARSLTELAFEHLARVLAVDTDASAKWVKAFDTHETACERLGAIHLLGHGIWGFKVSSPGSATDLVFGEPLENHAVAVRRTARALVLTEWKRVLTEADIEAKAGEARRQTASYSAGVLGDMELKNTRYVVLVCRQRMAAPDDHRDGEVTYRHILLPVAPDLPSTEARRGVRRITSRSSGPDARIARAGR